MLPLTWFLLLYLVPYMALQLIVLSDYGLYGCLFTRFCFDCKGKVMRAYQILSGELDPSTEKG